MIGGYVRNTLSHPAVATGAGFLIGWHALSGSLFGGLLAAGTIGTFLQARKMQQAKDAASAAAIAEAQQCEDPNDPVCVARAKSAAIAAGQAALASRGAVLPVWAAVTIAALVAALVVLVTMK
jgi:hypothetical protein